MPNDLPTTILSLRYFSKMTDPDVVTDATITQWIRLGEQRISDQLRNADMVQIDTATFPSSTNRVKLPLDFRMMDYLRWDDDTAQSTITWLNRDKFYDENKPSGKFTTSGMFLMLGGDPSGRTVEMHYFGDVPPLVDVETWLSRRYPRLLLDAAMTASSMGMKEEELAPTWEADCAATIQRLNDDYQKSIAHGSRLSRWQKGFG